jgi:hypothetical protein
MLGHGRAAVPFSRRFLTLSGGRGFGNVAAGRALPSGAKEKDLNKHRSCQAAEIFSIRDMAVFVPQFA